jgi:hypothetical protein
VVPKIATKRRSQREHLLHLAIVFKFELRLKIVAELFIRAMSPTEFCAEFGGGSLERVAQHFAALEEHGWLRRVGYKRREMKGPGAPETLYRATEIPFFDSETWSSLPYSLRLAYSWSSFAAIARLLRQGIEGAFFEERPSRPLTCTPLEVDEIGWERIVAKLATDFESIFEEQEDAKIRCSCSGEELIRAGILQVAFESPRTEERLALCLAEGSFEPPVPLAERMAPIFADDLSLQILTKLNVTDMSVKQFHREVAPGDMSEGAVRYRFDRLKELAWIAVVDQVRKRAAYENIYRATKPAIAPNGLWAEAPEALERTETWKAFLRLSDLVKEAIVAGTFDIRDDRHLSWSIANLDREGWLKVVNNMNGVAAFTAEEEERARKRIAAGAKPVTMVLGLTALESRIGPDKAP